MRAIHVAPVVAHHNTMSSGRWYAQPIRLSTEEGAILFFAVVAILMFMFWFKQGKNIKNNGFKFWWVIATIVCALASVTILIL